MQPREGIEIGPTGCISGFEEEREIEAPCSRLWGKRLLLDL